MKKQSTPSKQKRFLYKKVTFLKEPGFSFEEGLVAALKKRNSVKRRMQDGDDVGEKRFINYHNIQTTEDGSGRGCEFLGFETGSDQSIIQLLGDTNELPVEVIKAGADREFVGGSVYFIAMKDHVVLFQSASLKTLELETYLNWLLRDKSKILDESNGIQLSDHVSSSSRSKVKSVKGIKLSSPMANTSKPEVVKSSGKEGKVAKTEEIVVVPRKQNLKALKEFFGDQFDFPTNFNSTDLMGISEVEIQIFLKWKGYHKEDDNRFMDSIASQLRHVDGEIDYEVESKHGSYGKKDFKIRKNFSVQWTNSNRPKFDDLFPKMTAWLATLISDGRVDP